MMNTYLRRFLTAAFLCGVAVLLGTGCTKQARKARYLARANSDFKAGKYDRAEIEYMNVLRVPPPSPEAMANLGMIYLAQGKMPQAYHLLTNAVALAPENLEARLKLAQLYVEIRNLRRARQTALEILGKQPVHAQAMVILAESSLKDQIEETLKTIEALPPAAKNIPEFHIARGTLLGRRGAFEQAATDFRQAITLEPKSSRAYAGLAGACFALTNRPAGEAALKKAAELAPLRSELRLNYAQYQAMTGATNEARAAVEDLTQKAPDYIPAWLYLAQLTFGVGDTNGCAASLEKLLARDAVNFEALLLKGRLLLATGNVTNAVSHLERVNMIYPRPSAAVQHELARAYLLNRESGKAVAALTRAIATDTNFVDGILMLAELNVGQRNPGPAIASLRELLNRKTRLEPRQLETALFLLTTAYLAVPDLDQAAAQYEQMTKLFPSNVLVHVVMGQSLKRQRPAKAREAYQSALQISPDAYLPLSELVMLDLREKKYDDALRRVNLKLEERTNAPSAYYLLGVIHNARARQDASDASTPSVTGMARKLDLNVAAVRQGYENAESAWLKALELAPDNQATYVALAQLYVGAGQHQRALDRLDLQIARKTNSLEALILKGMILSELNNYAGARDAYEACLTIQPNADIVLNNLAYVYSEKLEDLDKALQLATRARDLRPRSPEVADTLGWVLFRRGDYSRALMLLEDAERGISSRGSPVPPELTFHLGMACYMTGAEQDALANFQKFIEAIQTEELNADTKERKAQAEARLAILAVDPAKADAAAIGKLENALRESPGDPVALSRLAAIHARDGSPDKALQTYKSALERNPQSATILFRMAELYAGPLKDSAKAMETAREARKLAPQDPRIAHLLGRLAFASRDYTWAASLLQESARQLADSPEVAYDLAWSYYSLGKVAETEESLQTVVRAGTALGKADEAKRMLRMVELAKAADPSQGVTESEQVLKANPDYVPAMMVIAAALERQSKFANAAQTYEKVLAVYPQFSPATRNLAKLYFASLQDEKKAYEMAVKARQADPADAEVARILGILAFKRNEFVRAAQLLQESARAFEKDGELLYYLGMAYSKQKQRAPAQRALESALALNLATPLATMAQAELKSLKGTQ